MIPAPAPPPPPAAAPELPCIFDIESSGFGRGGYPVAVGWVMHDGRGRSTLIRPALPWTRWDAAVERVHGISRDRATAPAATRALQMALGRLAA